MHLELQRRQRGMHQHELASEIGIAQASVSNYETGKRDVPTGLLESIASVLRVSVAELLPDEVVMIVREPDLQVAVRVLAGSPERIEAILDAERRAGKPREFGAEEDQERGRKQP